MFDRSGYVLGGDVEQHHRRRALEVLLLHLSTHPRCAFAFPLVFAGLFSVRLFVVSFCLISMINLLMLFFWFYIIHKEHKITSKQKTPAMTALYRLTVVFCTQNSFAAIRRDTRLFVQLVQFERAYK